MNKKEILFNVINNLTEERIIATWEKDTNISTDNGIDGEIMLRFHHHPPLKLLAEIKKEIRITHLKKLEDRLQHNPNYLLIAERIGPSLKGKLKEKKLIFSRQMEIYSCIWTTSMLILTAKKALKVKLQQIGPTQKQVLPRCSYS